MLHVRCRPSGKMAATWTQSRGAGKNLMCGKCGGVFCQPRILCCFHTFCLPCLEDLTKRAVNRPFIKCPDCGKRVTIPKEGAKGFKVNLYISEEELEHERNKSNTRKFCTNPHHRGIPMDVFCVGCDKIVCVECKRTTHKNHTTEDLAAAAARSVCYLERSKRSLDKRVSFRSKKSTHLLGKRLTLQQNHKALSDRVRKQYEWFVEGIHNSHESLQKKIRTFDAALEERLREEEQIIQTELAHLTVLQGTVHGALTAEASDSNKLTARKRMREFDDIKEERPKHKIKKRTPAAAYRNGVNSFNDFVSEDGVNKLRRIHIELYEEFRSSKEMIVHVFEYKERKEVYGVCQQDSESFAVLIWDPSSGKTTNICLDEEGVEVRRHVRTFNGQSTCKRYSKHCSFYTRCERRYDSETVFRLNSKGYRENMFQVYHFLGAEKTSIFRVQVISEDPFERETHRVFDTNPVKPVAFDATSTGDVIALVETVEDEESQREYATKRNVCLYRRDQSTPVAKYAPPDSNFCPSDVCFWQENDQEQLLVADRQNDCVHVVSIHENQLHFQRFLAAGDGNLVRPTALNVDDKGRVWIGCENGRVLRCEILQTEVENDESDVENDESDVENDESDVENDESDVDCNDDMFSVSDCTAVVSDEEHSLLNVENSSESTGSSLKSVTRRWINTHANQVE